MREKKEVESRHWTSEICDVLLASAEREAYTGTTLAPIQSKTFGCSSWSLQLDFDDPTI